MLHASSEAQEIPPEEQDFDLLSTKIADLVKELDEDLRGCSLYLVGMMGSGKSTVGKMLANTLKYKFFDVDTMIEMTHDGKKVSEIFKEFGQVRIEDTLLLACNLILMIVGTGLFPRL